jgi:hypothetical protein
VLLTDGPADLSEEDRARLAAAGVPVDERDVTEIVSAGGELAAIASGSLAAAAVVQSLLADDVGLPVPEWSRDVNA